MNRLSTVETALSSRDATLGYRRFETADLDDALTLSQRLGWPHRREDWAQMLEVGSGLALRSETGALVGTGFCIDQGAMATLGLIVVDDAWQGRGLGREMMERLMQLAGERPVSLVATTAGAPLYRKMGFETCGLVCQYQGVIEPTAGPTSPALRRFGPEDREALLSLAPDNAVHGLAVNSALEGVLLDNSGEIEGVALWRAFGRGYHIGPVLADSASTTRALIEALLAAHPGDFVRLDLVDPPADDTWLQAAGLRCVDRVEQMHRGTLPVTDGPRRAGLMTQAMG
ncbi:GNAT family N-acetyltransferase [Salinicola aestuarinus]|uniref:GNAT family N-acetyltransferase n=1 Tax=Salinicola aestuarinus TaxID=1949082 RepID=UPI000DA16CBF|nr:GNAT family N-acetyltransferase [Salinicola aestuarinus]